MSSYSPKMRRCSDSYDYDDELAELHEASSYARYSDRMKSEHRDGDSDEDTEDASEDGDFRPEEPTEIKEQIYFDKLAVLKAQLQELENGSHSEFAKRLAKLDKAYRERLKLNEAWRDYEATCIERNYLNEKKAAVREFEEKKIELRENLISELEEKKKQIEQERYCMELTNDLTEVKTVSTRKLRRRPNEPAPQPEKRRKTPQSQITFLLDDKDIEDDLRAMIKGKAVYTTKKFGNMETSVLHPDARIEDGKLFYEKRWFHRGQPVYVVEGKDGARTSGIINCINQDSVWVRKLNDPNKVRVTIGQLQKGKFSIKRRA